jgi:hypothetical protein
MITPFKTLFVRIISLTHIKDSGHVVAGPVWLLMAPMESNNA